MSGVGGVHVVGSGEARPFSRGLVGYLTNLGAVRDAAGVRPEADAAEAAAALVKRHGIDAVARLRGTFALALWDEDAQHGLLATDHLGAGGLYYRPDGRRLVFASELRALLDLLGDTPAPDEDALVRWLAYDTFAPGQTLYDGIRRLGAGELIELDRASYRVRRYWEPRYAAPVGRSVQDQVDAVAEAATAAVTRRLDPQRDTGVLLSGGLDSSSVVAFARQGSGAGLLGFSAVFPAHPGMDESPLISDVAEVFRLPLAKLEVRGGSMVAAALDYLAAWRLPSVSPNVMFLRPLARAAAEEGVAVLLDGEGGDELFGGSPYVFADLVMRGRLLAALRLADRLPGVRVPRMKVARWVAREWALKGAVPYGVHSMLRGARPSHYGARWLTESAARQHGRSADPWAWKTLAGPRWWANLAFEFTEGRVQTSGHDFLRHKSALAGVEGRHPYLEDVDLVTAMLAIPSEASYDDTFDRPLLRRAVEGLVPDAVRLRTEKSYFNALFEDVLTSTDRPALLDLLAEGAHVARYVHLELLRSWILGTSTRPANWCWIVWRSAMAECWLRRLEDASYPERAAREWGASPPQLELRRASKASVPA
jgi:asparagine synthase (glutamine-hydrolysing)